MTTISRLVAIRDAEVDQEHYLRKARFLDHGQLHIPLERQICAIEYHLERVHRVKAPLDAIVLNDLDMGALRPDIVAKVGELSQKHRIPVIVRARRNAQKYTDFRAAALVCTLAEWKEFVSSNHEPGYWAANIGKREVAEEFARETLSVFHETSRFVVLVGDDWIDQIITLEESADEKGGSLVIRKGLPVSEKGKSQQVGASDVFAGALALGIVSSGEEVNLDKAVRFARNVAKAYQANSWNRVPSRGMNFLLTSGEPDDAKQITARRFGTRFLPVEGNVVMSRASTGVPNIVSITPDVQALLNALSKEVSEGEKSIVLAAAGGSGKSEISKHLINTARLAGFEGCDLSELKVRWSWATPDKTVAAIKKACASRSNNRPFVVIDEALKLTGAGKIATNGVVLLNAAAEEGIRFLFIDADFAKLDVDKLRSQFLRRLSVHELPPPWKRPFDVPYAFFALLRMNAVNRNVEIGVRASALVAVIEWFIADRQNFGHLNGLAKRLVSTQKELARVCVTWNDLPADIRGPYQPYQTPKIDEYVPKFD